MQLYPISKPAKLTVIAHFEHRISCEGVLKLLTIVTLVRVIFSVLFHNPPFSSLSGFADK